MPISGLEKVDPDVLVYHNGTAFGPDAAGKKRLFTTGGRVLTLVARGKSLARPGSRPTTTSRGLGSMECATARTSGRDMSRGQVEMIIFGLEGTAWNLSAALVDEEG